MAILAGAFIALGAVSRTVTVTGDFTFGVKKRLGGLIFSLGLILIIAGGAGMDGAVYWLVFLKKNYRKSNR